MTLLSVIAEAPKKISLAKCFEAIDLSSQRYHAWVRKKITCRIVDLPSCPKSNPSRLTGNEISKIKEYANSEEPRHISVSSLHFLAKRAGDVFASESSWRRVIDLLGIDRKRKRVYPARPKIGIRASKPGEPWHLDMSVIRLVDGTRCFIQCVIDNLSRYVLGWQVTEGYGGIETKNLLEACLKKATSLGKHLVPEVIVDSGTENLNKKVDELIVAELIRRTIAQIDVVFSNSMVESLFHRLKNRHLHFSELTNIATLRDLVGQYIDASNNQIPMKILKGATPLEVISGQNIEEIGEFLSLQQSEARRRRVESNRNAACGAC